MNFTSPPSIQGLSTEDAYCKLDEEIFQLETRLSSVRTLRNSLAPICKFPNEILSKIFIHSQEHEGSAFAEDTDLHTRFVISWICRHWRDVALSCARLWTIVVGDDNPESLNIVEELLNRSRNLPLSIYLHDSPADVLKACMPHMSRVQELKLVELPNADITQELLALTSPLLESLEIDRISFRPSSVMKIQSHLQRLILGNLFFSIAVPFITPSLTILHLRHPLALFDANQLLTFLPSLCNLTELVLDRVLQYETVNPVPSRISLPSLQTLHILEGDYSPVFEVLKALDIPQAVITVSWPTDRGQMETRDWHEFWTNFHGYLRIPLPIRRINVQLDTPDYTLSFSSSSASTTTSPSHHHHHQQQHHHNHHVFEFAGQDLDENTTSRLLRFAIPLDDLETLEINDIPEDTLPKLSELPNLKSVTVSGEDSAWQFMEAIDIEDVDSESGDTIQKKIPFMAIKELTIHGVELQDENGPALEDILENRWKAGFGLEKLVLVKCEEVDVELFRKFVKVVEVVE